MNRNRLSSATNASVLAALEPVRCWYAAQPLGSWRRKLAVPALKLASRCSLASLPAIVPADRSGLRFTNCDSMILPSIHWFGVYGYEGVLCDYWPLFCTGANNIVEIGANIGFFTVLGSRASPGGKYLAVEPLPENAALLRANLKLNGISHVTVVEAAAVAGKERDTVTLNVPQERYSVTVGAFVDNAAEGVSERMIERKVTVHARTMADLVSSADLIKIDAEGIEHHLLSAVFELIACRKPTIFVEVLPNSSKLKDVIVKLTQECKYRIYGVPAYHHYEAREIAAEDLRAGALERMFSKDVILTNLPLPSLSSRSSY